MTSITVYILIALKIIVGISILNVWLLQAKKNTKWRGGNATNIIEEFKAYGLSKQVCYVVGFLKVSFALLLLLSNYRYLNSNISLLYKSKNWSYDLLSQVLRLQI